MAEKYGDRRAARRRRRSNSELVGRNGEEYGEMSFAGVTFFPSPLISAGPNPERQRVASLQLPLMDWRARRQEAGRNVPKQDGAKSPKLDCSDVVDFLW
jgi:hypothetical protein